jgi:hypothetical protein
MASIHIGTLTLTNANVALSLASGLTGTAVTRTMARQLFIQCNNNFSVGAANVTPSTGIVCSAVNPANAAQNAPHTPVLGSTAAPTGLLNLAEVFCVSATPGAIVTFLWIP